MSVRVTTEDKIFSSNNNMVVRGPTLVNMNCT
jgi:hypothetical protein